MSGHVATQWFYGRHGEEFGPFDTEQFHALASAGRIRPTDMVWRDGLVDWVSATEVSGLFTRPHNSHRTGGHSPAPLPQAANSGQGSVATTSNARRAVGGKPTQPSTALRYTQNALVIALILGSLLAYWRFSRGRVAIENFDEAMALSRETGQDVFFMFTAPWCGACNFMKADLLKNRQVLEGRILCLIDFDSNPDLVKEHGVKLIPAYGVWRDGQVVKKKVGCSNAERLRAWLDE